MVKDDHSRFLLLGRWFFHQYKVNAFMVLHEGYVLGSLPKAILSDRDSQFKADQLHGETEYQFDAATGDRAQVWQEASHQGKIEKNFRFIHRDLVLENPHHTDLDGPNVAWKKWMEWYNWRHRHRVLNGDSPADHYVKSLRQPTAENPELLSVHEEPRKVRK